MEIQTPVDVLHFWFEELTPRDWFSSDAALDKLITDRFLNTHALVSTGNSSDWRATPEGRLAEIIVLDQFSRNIFRGKPSAFLCDELALVLAQEAVELGLDKKLTPQERHFLYMPYMHSESRDTHEVAIQLFEELGNESALAYEREHKDIIDRFGRYPHRNAILGRTSTPEEQDFLQTNRGFRRIVGFRKTSTINLIMEKQIKIEMEKQALALTNVFLQHTDEQFGLLCVSGHIGRQYLVTPQHAKRIWLLLGEHIQQFEKEQGKINATLPKSVAKEGIELNKKIGF